MKRSETAFVLARIAAIDNRRLDDPSGPDFPILESWHRLIGDLRYADCIEAVDTHRKASTEWLQPAHIREIVREIRGARTARVQIADLTGDVDPRDGRAYLATYRHRIAAMADGLTMDQANALPLPPEAAHAAIDRKAHPVLTAGDW
jgi:hypothetical protein